MIPQLSSEVLRPLIDEEKAWFQERQWSQQKLVECYANVLVGIDGYVETLDRGNANRLVAYHAKKAAIQELVPDVEDLARTFSAMNALAQGINQIRAESSVLGTLVSNRP